MKLKTNQSGAAHLVAVLLVILIAAVGVVGWKVWDNSNKDTKTDSASSNSITNDNSSVDADKDAGEPLSITALGLKVNDPDNRGLQLHTEKICAADCDTKDSYFIRDNNDSYFEKCDYATGVRVLSQTEVDQLTNESGSTNDQYYKKYSKKIGDTYYMATLGSNFQSPCGDATDEAFVESFRQYVLKNLVAL